jgi:ubiquinone/menaquinone biosynthesis C-methylase UbiE
MRTCTNNDWNRRCVDFRKIHGDSSTAFSDLVGAINWYDGIKIADVMCGYGDVSRHLLEEAKRRNTRVDLSLIDFSETQLNASRAVTRPTIPNNGSTVDYILEDARDYSRRSSDLSSVIMKMGLHEVPLYDQGTLISNWANHLMDGGEIFVWEIFGGSPEAHEFFKDMVRTKDALADLTDFVANRYLPSEREINRTMRTASLDVTCIYDGEQRLTEKYLVDFEGDKRKIDAFNGYVRNNLTDSLREELDFEDLGNSVEMTFQQKIFRGVK